MKNQAEASIRSDLADTHIRQHNEHMKTHHRPRRDLGGMARLDSLTPGQSGEIVKIGGEGALRRRLLDMGLTPGTKVHMKKYAPLGDPIELNLRGYDLSLLRADAHNIGIMPIGAVLGKAQ